VRRIRWTTPALDDLISIVERVKQENPSAASSIAKSLLARIEQLKTFPSMGRRGEVEGTREIVLPPYIIVYRMIEDVVLLLHIWHGAQDWR
jgi:toxin ParE1/3/4